MNRLQIRKGINKVRVIKLLCKDRSRLYNLLPDKNIHWREWNIELDDLNHNTCQMIEDFFGIRFKPHFLNAFFSEIGRIQTKTNIFKYAKIAKKRNMVLDLTCMLHVLSFYKSYGYIPSKVGSESCDEEWNMLTDSIKTQQLDVRKIKFKPK